MIPVLVIFFLFIAMFLLSRFLKKVDLLILPFFFGSLVIIFHFFEYREQFLSILIGAIFFYFLGILSDRYKLDFFIEFLFQSLIIAAVVFLGLKIFFIRNFHGGFYYFSEIKSLFFSFFWFFVNINALKIIAKKGEFFLSIGLCINLTLMIMIFVQNMGIE
ncbi:MAG: hypothetical protein WC337_07810, partial [Candidatus Muiribacteriota bacterium]